MRRIARFMPRNMGQQPVGGSIPAVQNRFTLAQFAAQRGEFPIIAANIYAPPSVVTLPLEVNTAGQGQVDRIYQPAETPQSATTMPKTFGEKLGNWFSKGRFA